jgi:hypothetical protein
VFLKVKALVVGFTAAVAAVSAAHALPVTVDLQSAFERLPAHRNPVPCLETGTSDDSQDEAVADDTAATDDSTTDDSTATDDTNVDDSNVDDSTTADDSQDETVTDESTTADGDVEQAQERSCDDDDDELGPAEVAAEGDDSGDEAGGAGPQADSHGGAVRVAAHCDVKGRAHGELVSSIARDHDATVADAEAACADALAEADTESATDVHGPSGTHGGPDQTGEGHGPPDHSSAGDQGNSGGGSSGSHGHSSEAPGHSSEAHDSEDDSGGPPEGTPAAEAHGAGQGAAEH